MHNKLFEAVIRGRAIDYYVTKISRAIIHALRDDEVKNHIRQTGSVQFMLDIPEVVNDMSNLAAIGVAVKDEEGYVSAESQYLADFDEREDSNLLINISIPQDYDNRVFFELIPELKEVLRHEIEHVSQDTDDLESLPKVDSLEHLWESLDRVFEYYASKPETAAYVTGIYRRAKLTKQDMTDVLQDKLHGIYRTGIHFGWTEEQLKPLMINIGSTWVEYLQKRYPNWRE